MLESDDANEIDTSNAQCKNCGSGLVYDPKTKGLKCKSCSSVTDFIKSRSNLKNPFIEGSDVENNKWSKESRVFRCDTCGAQVVLTGFDVTTICPYCGSTYVSEIDELPGLKPDRVIPFAFNEKDAVNIFANGVKKRFFAPRALKKCLPENKVRGIYVPTFTFDANTYSSYRGTLEKTETKTDSKGNSYTKTETIHISGNIGSSYCDMVVESCSKLNESQMNSLLPYNLNAGYSFDANFLRGYSVEHYQKSLNDCFLDAKTKMDADIKRKILNRYDYTSVVSLYINTDYDNLLYSYSLLPVYAFKYEYKKKQYVTIMNGQTGRIGKGLPTSALKVTLVVVGVLVIIVALVLIIMSAMDML